jgi:inner membrane protein
MDPLTQGVLGAALPQATAARGRFAASAGLLGFLGGMAADLDVLIRSSSDPLLFLEYHRQFTHSLVFIPAGGLLCALILHGVLGRRRGLKFRQSWLFCTLGYATHALLDACTTYGTMLFWPFSDARIAWNTISIIDPLFTVPLLVAVVLAARRNRPLFARLGLLWAWTENQVAAAAKLGLLGQTASQRLLSRAMPEIIAAVAQGLALDDDGIGCAAPGLGLASAGHETQYSRLFRS